MDSKLLYKSKVIKALYTAAKAHKNQFRKGNKDIPYIVHPVEVAMILKENDMPEDLIIAGLLHDTLEDTPITEEEIELEFGKRILELVLGASERLEERETTPWKTRKTHTIEYLANAPKDIKKIACADKLANIRSILRDYEIIGEKLWERFNEKNPLEQKWYYEGLVKSLEDLNEFEMYIEFKNSVEILFNKYSNNY